MDRLLAVLLATCLASTGTALAAVDVTTCPARISAGTVGVVQADLDCSTPSGADYVVLERGATLDLNGHTLTFHPAGDASALVRCEARCEVRGPGALEAVEPQFASVFVSEGGRLTIRDAALRGMVHGVVGIGARVKVIDTSIEALAWGIAGVSQAVVQNVTVTVSQPGGYCIGATDELRSVVKGHDVTLLGCVDGIWASNRVKLRGLTLVGAASIGVYARRRLTLIESTVTGSGIVDLLSTRPPKLIASTCDRSGVDDGATPMQTWGVCAND